MANVRSAALLFMMLLVLGCERMETVETVYPDFRAAVQAEAVGDAKWIPAFLPTSATRIREVHNLDTNEQWLAFLFSSADLPALGGACRPVGGKDIVFPRRAPGPWWPRELTRQAKGHELPQGRYDYYSCPTHAGMAVAGERPEAYFWTSID
jgi:hypothetical protein